MARCPNKSKTGEEDHLANASGNAEVLQGNSPAERRMTIGQLFLVWFSLSCLTVPVVGACIHFGLHGREAAGDQDGAGVGRKGEAPSAE